MAGNALPAPVGAPVRTDLQEQHRRTMRERLAGAVDAGARPPYAVIGPVRVLLSMLLSTLCLLTAAGALLLLMAWRQQRTDGLVANQTERMWDVWDALATIERYVAAGAAAIAIVWVAVATVNVRRATGRRRNPLVSAAAVAVGTGGVWLAGREVVAPALDSDDWIGAAAGLALQAVLLAIPLLAVERVADTAAARRRPARVAYVMALGFVAVAQISGALATIDRTTELDGWGRSGALVLIVALIEVLGVLAFGEAARALEEGTQHRYELRHRFGESVLAQIGI